MLADLIRNKIETYYQDMRVTSPLFAQAGQGHITPKQVQKYLESILYLIEQTPIHLERARERSEELGRNLLRQYFESKLKEEDGHDKWAVEDLRNLGKEFDLTYPGEVSLEMIALVNYIRNNIEKDPALYLPYILLAEYFTVLIAPEFLNNLQEKCGIPATSLSVIGNHAELDRDHVRSGFEEIEKVVEPKRYVGAFSRVLDEAMDLYSKFCIDVVKA